MEHFQAVCLCFFPAEKAGDNRQTLNCQEEEEKKKNLWLEWHSHLTEQLNHGALE